MPLSLMAPGAYGQLFTMSPGMSQVTTGTFTGIVAAWCHEDGSIDVTWPGDTTPVTIPFTGGDVFGFSERVDVYVSSGTWSVMG